MTNYYIPVDGIAIKKGTKISDKNAKKAAKLHRKIRKVLNYHD